MVLLTLQFKSKPLALERKYHHKFASGKY